MNTFSMEDFRDLKILKSSGSEKTSFVINTLSNKKYLLRVMKLDFFSDRSYYKLENLFQLSLKTSIPSLIPSIIKKIDDEKMIYLLAEIENTLEETIKIKKLKKNSFAFNEIINLFKSLLNGLAFLQLNKYMVKLSPNTLLITTNNELKCQEIELLTKDKLEHEIINFGNLMLSLCLAKPYETENQFHDKFSKEEMIKRMLQEIKKKFSSKLSRKEEFEELDIFLNILKNIFIKKKHKKIDFVTLFVQTLQIASNKLLENIILKIDKKSDKEDFEEEIKKSDCGSTENITSMKSANSFQSMIIENKNDIGPLRLIYAESKEILNAKQEKYELMNESKSFKFYGLAAKGSVAKLSKDYQDWLAENDEIKAVSSINLNCFLSHETDCNELLQILSCLKKQIMSPIKTIIFQNSMMEKLIIQAPWAKFYRNIFYKKNLDELDNEDEAIRLIFEHEINWYDGMTDSQFKIIFPELINYLGGDSINKFRCYVGSYHNLTKKTLIQATKTLEQTSFLNMKELEIGFEIKDLPDKSISTEILNVIEKKLINRSNSLDVFSFFLNTYYVQDQCFDPLTNIIVNQKKLSELNISISYVTASMLKSRFIDCFEEKNIEGLQILSLGFFSWHYSNYLGDGSLDIILSKMAHFLPKNMIKFSFLFSSGGKFENTLTNLYNILTERIFDRFDIFLQGFLETSTETTKDIKSKIESILTANNPKILIESSFYNFSYKNKSSPSQIKIL